MANQPNRKSEKIRNRARPKYYMVKLYHAKYFITIAKITENSERDLFNPTNPRGNVSEKVDPVWRFVK